MNQNVCRAEFRKRFNHLVKKYDIKRVTLGKLTGANVGQINRWADGDLMPTWYQFVRLTEIFGVDDEYMLGCSVNERKYTAMFKSGSGT